VAYDFRCRRARPDGKLRVELRLLLRRQNFEQPFADRVFNGAFEADRKLGFEISLGLVTDVQEVEASAEVPRELCRVLHRRRRGLTEVIRDENPFYSNHVLTLR